MQAVQFLDEAIAVEILLGYRQEEEPWGAVYRQDTQTVKAQWWAGEPNDTRLFLQGHLKIHPGLLLAQLHPSSGCNKCTSAVPLHPSSNRKET